MNANRKQSKWEPLAWRHAYDLEQLSANPDIRDWSNIPTSIWKKGAPSFIQRSQLTRSTGKPHSFAIYNEEELVAVMAIYDIRESQGCAELFFWIDARAWKSGVARDYLLDVMSHAFDQLGLNRLATALEERNTLCIQLLESIGFRRRGRRLMKGTDSGEGETVLFLEKVRAVG